jgi:hypothetical protein
MTLLWSEDVSSIEPVVGHGWIVHFKLPSWISEECTEDYTDAISPCHLIVQIDQRHSA